MALKQMEEAYNSASPLERAARWPSTDKERRYAKLCSTLEAEKAKRQVDEGQLRAATKIVEDRLRELGVDPDTIE